MTQADLEVSLLERARHAQEAIRPFEPRFPYQIQWATSYDKLFSGEFNAHSGVDSLLDAGAAGRIVLHSHGGTGKTAVLRQLFELALERGIVPVMIDLKEWTGRHYGAWKSLADGNFERAELLLGELAIPRVSSSELATIAGRRSVLLLVDGLSEVTSSVGLEILEMSDGLARRMPTLRIVAADRFNRRPIRTDRWLIGEICEFSDEVVRQFVRVQQDRSISPLLRMAFFLDLAARSGLSGTSSGAQAAYLEEHARLLPDEIDRAASVAFAMYAANSSRVFRLADFEAGAGGWATGAMLGTGVLGAHGEMGFFRHHLIHDFFAARHVARHVDLWTSEHLDVLTFQATSFDPLVLVLEQLDSREAADRFVRSLYDWNVYGTAFAIAEGRRRGESLVGHEMETVIAAMMAERLWDPIVATRQRASDALVLFRTELAERLLQADSFGSVVRIIDAIPAESDWFEAWKALFSGERIALGTVATEISSGDSLVGWTLANVLKRTELGEDVQSDLRRVLERGDDTARWRVAHVLGAFPSEANASALIDRIHCDGYVWVRYGSARSLVEMASRASEGLMSWIFTRLRELAELLSGDEKVLAEVERAFFVEPPPANWRSPALRTLQELWRHAESADEEARRYEVMTRFADFCG